MKNKSIEELLDMEYELSNTEVEDRGYYQLIAIYETLFRLIVKDSQSEYATSLNQIRKKLIFCLINYGTYLKTEYKKDDRMAANSLRKALNYDRYNPVAHYRLGFLDYKNKNYTSAFNHFQDATGKQNDSEYKLTPQQQYNAHLYLTNCALYIAQKTRDKLEFLEKNANLDIIPKLPQSPLIDLIKQNESYLQSRAFKIITPTESRFATKEECEELVDSVSSQTIILYFGDKDNRVIFMGRERALTPLHAEILRGLLLEGTEKSPVYKERFSHLLTHSVTTGEIEDNTFSQNIRRLRGRLSDVQLTEHIISSKRINGRLGYYYSGFSPFMVMIRSDDAYFE